MPSADENPFISFKKHVDSAFRGIFSLSSTPNQETQHHHDRLDEVAREHIRQFLERRHPMPSPSPGSPGTIFNEVIASEIRQRAIRSWVTYSSYSPRNLQYLPQPIPRDKPTSSGEHLTFADAFEDLLAASSGKPMADINGGLQSRAVRGEKRNMLFGIFSSFGWIDTLERRRLWDSYFPELCHLPQTISKQPHFNLMRDLDTLVMCHEERKLQSMVPRHGLIDDGEYNYSSLSRELIKLYNPWMERIGGHVEQTFPEPQDEPKSEEDTYLSLKSDFAANGMFSMRTWGIASSEDKTEPEGTVVSKSCDLDTTQTTTSVSPEGLKTVTTVERGSALGMSRIKTTIVCYAADGNVLGRSVSYQMSTSHDDDDADRGDEESNDNGTKQQDRRDKSGWFWTK